MESKVQRILYSQCVDGKRGEKEQKSAKQDRAVNFAMLLHLEEEKHLRMVSQYHEILSF